MKHFFEFRKIAVFRLWMLLMGCMLICHTAGAETINVQIDELWYNLDTEKLTAEVTYKDGFKPNLWIPSGENYSFTTVDIPSTINYNNNNYTVTVIGICAFQAAENLESIYIPPTITNCGLLSFSGTKNLQEVRISDLDKWLDISFDGAPANPNYYAQKFIINGVSLEGEFDFPSERTYIQDYVLLGLKNVTKINLPDHLVSLGNNTFRYCTSLTSVNIPKGVTSIPNYCFYECSSLPFFYLPETINSIGEYAFNKCTQLTSINIPNGITSIPEYCFGSCSSLPSLTLPETINSIGSNAFYNCSSLLNLTLPETVTDIGDYAFEQCTQLASINIPNGVAAIPRYCFNGCSSLSSIELPETINEIGSYAFRNCSQLASVNIPKGVTSIPNYCFYECSSLPSLELPETINEIGSYAFYSCSQLASINIPNGITAIPERCFYGCSSLPSLELPETINEIGSYAFNNCSRLASINIPENLNQIGQSAFRSCSSLEKVNITSLEQWCNISFYSETGNENSNPLYNSKSKLYINNEPFKGFVTVNSGVTKIPSYTFRNCDEITSIKLPEGLTTLGERVVYNCSQLASINIPNGVTVIPTYCFYGCSSLPSLELPETINEIGSYAFRNCSQLASVNIPKGVTSIPNYCFYECSSLPSLELPESINEIGSYAFYSCSQLASINIPNGITSIPNYCFSGCSSLPSLELPKTINEIGGYAFYHCSQLATINIPNGVTVIPTYCFYGCSTLPSLELPETINEIGSYAFYDCSQLANVTCYAEEPPTVANSSVFPSAIYNTAELSVPFTSIQAYRDAEVWKLFYNITAIPTPIEGSIKIEDFDISANEEKTIPVDLDANLDGSNSYYGLQFDIKLPEGLTLTNVQLGNDLQEAGFNLRFTDRGEGVYRIIAVPTGNPAGVDAMENLLYLTVKAAGKLVPKTETIEIYNAFLSTADGGDVFLDNSDATVTFNSTVELVTITPEQQNVPLGGTCTFTATIKPQDAVNQNLVWTVSDPTVASISYDGLTATLQGLKLGSVTITATSPYDDAIKGEATLNVVGTLAIIGDRSIIKVTETLQLSASLTEADAVTPELIWSSSEPATATVEEETGLVTGVAPGTVVITATAKDYPDITATYEVVVQPILLGDANDNGIVTVADVVTIADFIIGHKVVNWCFVNADVIPDKEIKTTDITATVDIILNDTDYEVRRALRGVSPETIGDKLVSDNFESSSGMVKIGVALDNSVDYSALQAVVRVPEGMQITEVVAGPRLADHNLMYNIKDDGTVRIVIFSLTNSSFLPGNEPLFTLVGNTVDECGNLTIDNIIASSSANEEYQLGFEGGLNHGITTAIGGIDAHDVRVNVLSDGLEVIDAEGLDINVYTLAGQNVATIANASNYERIRLEAGIYIVAVANKSVKAIIK